MLRKDKSNTGTTEDLSDLKVIRLSYMLGKEGVKGRVFSWLLLDSLEPAWRHPDGGCKHTARIQALEIN